MNYSFNNLIPVFFLEKVCVLDVHKDRCFYFVSTYPLGNNKTSDYQYVIIQ